MAALDPEQPLIDGNAAPQVIVNVEAQLNVNNPNPDEYIFNFRRTMQHPDHNCGLILRHQHGGSLDCTWCWCCCTLWLAAHFWTLLFITLNVSAFIAILVSAHITDLTTVSIYAAFFGVPVLISAWYLYGGMYHCIPCAMLPLIVLAMVYQIVLLLMFLGFFIASLFGDSIFALIGGACFVAWWLDLFATNAVWKTYKW
eukprot:CAMPEP_0197022554 /NCGR_PEP_ID=MMETSP1384-20130603/3395_1 /TAXON_ID=29189 /ORGANISM="Ammonia sp." /LENGTH=198 /DNA_ID=CAMNT_0042450613 /DNA_START=24 /DNA_END=617 /DNA_ORIENTATION=+